MSSLTEKEILILDSISRNPTMSQRDLAKITGFSLGLINVILRKFIQSGYIKVSHLNKRKVEYTLTDRGFQEAIRKAHDQTMNTIRDYRSLQSGLANLLKDLHSKGYDYFSVHGDGELKDLIESTFQLCMEELSVTLGKEHKAHSRAVVLNVSAEFPEIKGEVINVLEKIHL